MKSPHRPQVSFHNHSLNNNNKNSPVTCTEQPTRKEIHNKKLVDSLDFVVRDLSPQLLSACLQYACFSE